MFKAFTENITSFIGGSKNPADAKSDGDDTQKLETEADIVQDTTNNGTESEKQPESSKDTNESEQKHNKVPPPRPAPPLTPSSSIQKPDTPPDSPAKSATNSESQSADGETDSVPKEENEGSSNEEQQKDKIDEKLEAVTEKAKAWGSYLFSMTKSAGANVSAKAKEIKKAVQENTIIGDFVKEQDKFVSEKKERARANEAAVPPWVGYNEEQQMKEQMLTLSNDKRNFLRNPPSGVQFHFDYDTCYPVAMATLAEDENLQKMRFQLVPKMVSEHDFWRNYFYRVSLIKQSTQLTSLAKQSSVSSNAELPNDSKTDTTEDGLVATEDKKAVTAANVTPSDQPDITDDADVTTGQDEFVSDAYNLEISDEDLIKEMEALRSSPGADGDWGFEVVGDSQELSLDEAALEKEIMEEMNKSTDDLK